MFVWSTCLWPSNAIKLSITQHSHNKNAALLLMCDVVNLLRSDWDFTAHVWNQVNCDGAQAVSSFWFLSGRVGLATKLLCDVSAFHSAHPKIAHLLSNSLVFSQFLRHALAMLTWHGLGAGRVAQSHTGQEIHRFSPVAPSYVS